jgi:hypothetical protein
MSTELVNPKPEDVDFAPHKYATKEAMLLNTAFGLTLIAARVRAAGEEGGGYANYGLPADPAELAFTLKGALRLEMAQHPDKRYAKYRRLWGSISGKPPRSKKQPRRTRKKDVPAWRSRVYTDAFAAGAEAAALLRTWPAPGQADASADLAVALAATTGPIVMFQVQDVYLDDSDFPLFSDLLAHFLRNESRLLALIGAVRILPTWKEMSG